VLVLRQNLLLFGILSSGYLLEISCGSYVINCFALRFVKGMRNHLCGKTEQNTHHRDHKRDHDDKGPRGLNERGPAVDFQSEHPQKREDTNRKTEYPAATKDVHRLCCGALEKLHDEQ